MNEGIEIGIETGKRETKLEVRRYRIDEIKVDTK